MGKWINRTLSNNLKRCSKCDKIKPISEFYKDKGSRDGHYFYCKTCSKSAAKAWQSDNWDKVLSNVSEYRKENPDKRKAIQQRRSAAIRGSNDNTLSTDEWNKILEEFQSLCAYCSAPWEHQDHFIPISKGGTHTADNVFPACAPCNQSKAAKMPLDWINEKNPNSF